MNSNADKILLNFIEIIREERLKQGISHEKLTALAGIHRTALSHIENNRRKPSLLICIKLANALGYQLSDLIKLAESE